MRRAVVFSLVAVGGCAMFAPHDVGVLQRAPGDLARVVAAVSAEHRDLVGGRSGPAFKVASSLDIGAVGKTAVFSPLSADTVLAMLLNGAQGDTFEVLARAMGLDEPSPDRLNGSYGRLMDILASQPGRSVKTANAVWSVQPLLFRPDYKQMVQTNYDADVRKLGSAGEGALRQVNDWVSRRTEGRIPPLFQRLDPQDAVVLVSALTLDADWPEPFPPATDAPFTLPSGAVAVPTLHKEKASFKVARTALGLFGELEFAGTIVLTLAVPAQGTPEQLLAQMTPDDWTRSLAAMKEREGLVAFPKFRAESFWDLQGPLTALGAGKAFQPEADFSLMSHDRPLWVTQVVQKAVLTVDERGARGAAATGAGMTAGAVEPDSLTVDRPFVFAVRETTTGTLLFLGVVNDPR